MSQHIATRWPNARNVLRPTMLRYVALTCRDRLPGALHGDREKRANLYNFYTVNLTELIKVHSQNLFTNELTCFHI